MHCSVARTLDIIGEWWTLLILRDAFYGVRRFEAFREHLGISRKVLTGRLQRLTQEEILKKVAYQENPVRFEYRLTQKGLDLLPILLSIMKWGDQWQTLPDEMPVVFKHKTCGHEANPKFVCSHCHDELHARDMQPKAGPGAKQQDLERLRQASINSKLFLGK